MLIRADARAIPLRDKCVQCAITSPPYFRLARLRHGAMGRRRSGVRSSARVSGQANMGTGQHGKFYAGGQAKQR